ncbi:hypothetical protein DPMN_074113 [Dreissena polymorpha]|uniref:Uncharacterized protein n=1 Tax=Dreissena polymorpha TaxID=45954 RepID=A0A9D3YI07_DREPO|nr:hypothetical protein DPMN_074113 [Dreissena polymorpha]
MISKHRKEHSVETALKDKTGIAMSLIRSKGDDKHNNKVVAEGHGCLLISSRPTKEFDSEQNEPCVHCRDWMLKSTLKRHQSKCIVQRVVDVSPLTKRNLILQSDILSGR